MLCALVNIIYERIVIKAKRNAEHSRNYHKYFIVAFYRVIKIKFNGVVSKMHYVNNIYLVLFYCSTVCKTLLLSATVHISFSLRA